MNGFKKSLIQKGFFFFTMNFITNWLFFVQKFARKVPLHLLLNAPFFVLHDMTVYPVYHVLRFMTDIVCNVLFGDIQGQHDRYCVVPQIVESKVSHPCLLEQFPKSVGYMVRRNAHRVGRLWLCPLTLCEQSIIDHGEHLDDPSACRCLCCLGGQPVLAVHHHRLPYGQGV